MKARLTAVTLLAVLMVGGASQQAPGPTTAATDPVLHPLAIDRDRVGIVLIDAQAPFWNSMAGNKEPVMARTEQLLAFSAWTKLPLVATFEHSVERNGWLPERLEKVFPEHGRKMVKKRFNCCGEVEFRKILDEMRVDQVVVAGAETDVCVLQSVLGLLAAGKQVFILEDCLFTNEVDPRPALERMYKAGAIPCTYKTFYFEVIRAVARRDMKPEWRERRRRLPDAARKVLKSPYSLPPRSIRK